MKKQKNIALLTQIDQFIKGNLSQEEIDELWEKFLRNPEYFHLFEAELHLRNLIIKGEKPDNINYTSESKILEVTGLRSWLFATAAAVLIVFGLQFFSITEQEALNDISLNRIDLSELSGIDVFRLNGEALDELELAINEAILTAYENDLNLAILNFTRLLDQPLAHNHKLKVEMNLGILLYNSGRYDEAVNFFNTVSNNPEADANQVEKSLWFKGNGYLKLGDLHNARDSMLRLHSLSASYDQPALALLRKIDLWLDYNSDEYPAE
jgi:tetratricopeptide (TPR) repeat protein